MGHRIKSRKRPCRICRRWFYPDARVGDRQKTCGDKVCQDKWHAKKCHEWNTKNRSYFKEVYLSKKLSKLEESSEVVPSPQSSLLSLRSRQLPQNLIQEVIGAQPTVIIEYIAQLLLKSFKEEMGRQLIEIKGEVRQLPNRASLRGDSYRRGP